MVTNEWEIEEMWYLGGEQGLFRRRQEQQQSANTEKTA